MADGVVRWTHNPASKRAKRLEDVAEGFFVLEHEATGRFYVGESARVSTEVDKQLALLAKGKHPCKLFNILYEKDDIIRVHEYPIAKAKERKQRIKLLLDETPHTYLILK